ncbi:nephrin-like [Ylistrum balloti]|uniref:nephrin-like n=1 Tax=Ylistrum balloti TaxID=509963 RepID=UPI002905B51B|nr:nephrin-like [Ylistrum balloti]
MELQIQSLTEQHAGYYYTMITATRNIPGGQMLVVTDQPTQPTITTSSQSPVIDTEVKLLCASTSRSKPDNNGLIQTSSWKLNGSEINVARFSINGSNLIINPVRYKDKYNSYTCVAREKKPTEFVGNASEESAPFLLTPRYGPQFLTIEGTEGRSPLIRGDIYGPVVCRTDCNPDCVLEWRKDGAQFIPSQITSEVTLTDRSLPRQREVTYTCKARVSTRAAFDAPSIEKNITVEVYYNPMITETEYQDDTGTYEVIDRKDVRYREGSSLILRVKVSSNPKSDVKLSRNQRNVTVGSLTSPPGTYHIRLNDLQCSHTGSYNISAINFVTRNRSNVIPSVKSFQLQVICAPRRQGTSNSVIEVAGKKGQKLGVNVTVIANPKPSGHWSVGVKPLPVITNNDYTYTIRGEVKVNTSEDFSDYHVNITNNAQSGSVLTVKFNIRPEDVPDKPTEFHASEVGINDVKVTWISGFDGGNPQQFHIDIMADGKDWMVDTLNISDEGQGALMVHKLKDLNPSSDYIIRLNVSNKIGKGNSSEIRVRTMEEPEQPSAQSTLTIIIIVVIVVLLVVIVAIIGVLVMKQRRNQQAGGTAKVVTTDDNNEYAVVCKPSKGGATKNKEVTTDSEYAMVMKPKKGGAEKNKEVTTDSEYAEVSKPKKGGAKKNKDASANNNHQPELIYENTGASSEEPKPGPSRRTNEDGLIYIDVEIKPQAGKGKGVIHGANDRTAYAFVDFTKTAPNPLPDDKEEGT